MSERLAPDEVAIRVAATVVDPSSDEPEASFSGVISEVGTAVGEGLQAGDTVVGTGPPADLVSVPSSEVWRLPSDSELSAEQAAAIPYICSFLQALREIRFEPGDRVLVNGSPAIRHLSDQLLTDMAPQASSIETNLPSNHGNGSRPDRPFDVLVHGLAGAQDLQLSLSALGENGRALLLVPPGPHVMEFDFYPEVHRLGLRLFPRRVGTPCRPDTCPDAGHSGLIELLERGRIDLEPLLAPVSASHGLSLEGIGAAEKLLAVSWA